MTSLAVSGVSEIEESEYKYIAKCLRPHIINSRNKHFITGAATGVDTLAAYLCYAWRREATHTVVVPNGRHNTEIVQFALAMDLDVLQMPEGTDHLDRNTEMIKLAEILVAFPPTENEQLRGKGGGTWSTIRRARKKGIPIYIYPVNRDKPWKEDAK
jgi:hypothetical protein